MKIQYLVDDIADVLTEYYIQFRDVHPSAHKRLLMRHHMKYAIAETFQSMYDPVDDIWSIDVLQYPHFHQYVLEHEEEYNREIAESMILDMRERLLKSIENRRCTIDNSDDVINIHVVPFDGFTITHGDIVSLLDLDCV